MHLRTKAPEGGRTPRRWRALQYAREREAFWSAVVLYRFWHPTKGNGNSETPHYPDRVGERPREPKLLGTCGNQGTRGRSRSRSRNANPSKNNPLPPLPIHAIDSLDFIVTR